ncbi:hypothetical protein M9H77_09564 [Catharanthus roseus]|uniref:Uncharacterized protein n=1 Tax=Catharanthus roseus TaxID=4058 RepID=A0ACC0C1B5_CATRO|nr:hypothetical protein M9H77_09564 [Catharanthus roseus]
MAMSKDVRVTMILECTSCIYFSKESSQYPNRLELRKFCPYCYEYTIHGEIKK